MQHGKTIQEYNADQKLQTGNFRGSKRRQKPSRVPLRPFISQKIIPKPGLGDIEATIPPMSITPAAESKTNWAKPTMICGGLAFALSVIGFGVYITKT